MKNLDEPKVVDLEPAGTPPRLSRGRRMINVIVGGGLLALGLYVLTAPSAPGRINLFALGSGAIMMFAGLVLAVSAIFPSFTLEKLDRQRWR